MATKQEFSQEEIEHLERALGVEPRELQRMKPDNRFVMFDESSEIDRGWFSDVVVDRLDREGLVFDEQIFFYNLNSEHAKLNFGDIYPDIDDEDIFDKEAANDAEVFARYIRRYGIGNFLEYYRQEHEEL